MKRQTLSMRVAFVVTLILIISISSLFIRVPSNTVQVFAENENVTSTTTTLSIPLGAIGRTNFDIPSIDFTLPDGSSVSPDFRSIYINSSGIGQPIFAYYNDYEVPENKPQFNAGATFTVDAYSLNPDTPQPESIEISIYKILSGDGSPNLMGMKLDNHITLSSNNKNYTIPEVTPGRYILDTIVKYPFGIITLVYTMEIQVNTKT